MKLLTPGSKRIPSLFLLTSRINRMIRKGVSCIAPGVLVFILYGCAYGQGVGASGNLKGTVTDANRAVVSSAKIAVVASETVLQRTTLTDDAGEYGMYGLAPTIYDVSVAFQGFEPAVKKGIIVTVGETVIVDFQLNVSPVTAGVQVPWEAPVVDTQRASQANTIAEKYIRNLPIDRRDYLTYALLAPGVSDSRRLTDNTEFRVKQTPQSGLSVYGSNGRGNSVTVDGGEANDNTGGVLPTLSQEAVQEFQINRSNYSADLGGASGASINVVSKSGTNELHGSAFAFIRHDVLDARDPFAFSSALDIAAVTDPGSDTRNLHHRSAADHRLSLRRATSRHFDDKSGRLGVEGFLGQPIHKQHRSLSLQISFGFGFRPLESSV